MKRRIIAVMVVLCMLLSMGIGCNKKTDTPVPDNEKTATDNSQSETNKDAKDPKYDIGDLGGLTLPLVDKPTTITINVESEYPDRDNSWMAKKVEELTGIKLEIIEMPNASMVEKVKVTVASGKLYDIMYGIDPRQVNSLGMQGAFTPIDKLAEEYDLPNFKKIFVEENPWVIPQLSAEDGNLYFWPRYNYQRDVNHGFMYRKDIFDKHGIKPWNNTDEFYAALKKLKELYPDSYPYANKYKEAVFKTWTYSWGMHYPYKYDYDKKEWQFAAVQPEYKEMLDFMKKLYNEGLIDPEFLTDTAASWTAKMTSNKAFVTYDWIGRLDMFRQQVKDTMPEYDLRYGFPIGPTGMHFELAKVGTTGVQIANSSKVKEAAIKFLDFATSPAGAKLLTVGMEGEVYELDENGKVRYPEFPADKLVGINDLMEKYGIFLMGIYTRVDPQSVYLNYTEREQEAQDLLLKNNRIRKSNPILSYTADEEDIRAEIESGLDKAALEFSAKYILEPSYGDAEWNAWLEQAEKLGIQKLDKVYSDAQKRLDSKMQ